MRRQERLLPAGLSPKVGSDPLYWWVAPQVAPRVGFSLGGLPPLKIPGHSQV